MGLQRENRGGERENWSKLGERRKEKREMGEGERHHPSPPPFYYRAETLLRECVFFFNYF